MQREDNYSNNYSSLHVGDTIIEIEYRLPPRELEKRLNLLRKVAVLNGFGPIDFKGTEFARKVVSRKS